MEKEKIYRQFTAPNTWHTIFQACQERLCSPDAVCLSFSTTTSMAKSILVAAQRREKQRNMLLQREIGGRKEEEEEKIVHCCNSQPQSFRTVQCARSRAAVIICSFFFSLSFLPRFTSNRTHLDIANPLM